MATDPLEAIDEIEAEDEPDGDDTPTPRGLATDLRPDDVMERIRAGEVIRNARIGRLRFKGDFPLPVRLDRVEVERIEFDGATFHEAVAFERCKLAQVRSGRGATFLKGFSLKGSTLVNVHFCRLKVQGPWQCDNIRTVKHWTVIDSHFADRVRFWEARFGGWVDFKKTTFGGEADFRSFHADEGFILTDCKFLGNALFRGATCCKKWDAGRSRFDRLLDLSKVKFHDFAYLEAMVAGPDHQIAFHNAVAERILIRTEQVEGKLASERSGDHHQAMHEYGLLKRIYEGLHRYEQEDWAFYRFKVNQRRSRTRSWRKPWTRVAQAVDWLFLDLGCGYGTNPFRAVVASAVLMLFFGLIYMLDVSALPIEKLPFGTLAATHPLNRVMVGLLTSVSVFTSGFGSLRDAASGWMNIPLIVESLLGTLLWGLFIVAFGRKVIR